MRRFVRYSVAVVCAGLILVVAVLGILYTNTLRSRPVLEGTVALRGLEKAVMIKRDDAGVPLIEAASMDDALYSIGFLHAQERYFQMDLMRRKAAGELAELFGGRALEADKAVRVHRFRTRAKSFVASLPDDQRAALRRYTAGVNAGLTQLGSSPFEYSTLMTSPAAWAEEDTLLVNMAMYLMLQTQQDTIHPETARQKLIAHYDIEYADFMLASRSEWDSPMKDTDAVLAGQLPKLLVEPPVSVAAGHQVAAAVAGKNVTHPAENIIGSNSWAVSGRKSVDGRAILANDMHLPLQQPNTFYRFSLKLAGHPGTIVGVSVPGVPALVAGSNGKIAWGLTNSNGDWNDLVRIGKQEAAGQTTTVRETIAVKWGSPVTIDVRETRWGPVVAEDAQAIYSMSWVAHHAEGNNLKLVSLLTESSLDGALRTAAGAGVPHMNILFADNNGGAAWTIAGRIPRRYNIAGDEPAVWSEGKGWNGWLAAEEYPRLSSTDRDYLWTANNRVVGGEEWHKIGVGSQFALGVRAQRIQKRLAAMERPTELDMHALQLDDTALLMKRWHALIGSIIEGMPASAQKKELADVIGRWNGRAEMDSAAYRVIRRFRDEVADDVMPGLLKQVLSTDQSLRWFMIVPSWETPLWRVVSERPVAALPAGHTGWNQYFENVLLNKVYKPYKERYNGDLAMAKWSDANVSSIRHPLSSSLPFAGAVLDMPSVPMNGDSNTILAQSQSFGPAMRLVVSPGREGEGVLTMPAGQAGNPLTPYFARGHQEWQQGIPLPLLPGKPQYVLQLVPQGSGRP